VKYLPNIKSAIKRVKVTSIKNLRNRMVKSQLKSTIKKFQAAVAAGNMDDAKALLVTATSAIDKAVSKGTIHKNAANRKKAQLYRYLKAQ